MNAHEVHLTSGMNEKDFGSSFDPRKKIIVTVDSSLRERKTENQQNLDRCCNVPQMCV